MNKIQKKATRGAVYALFGFAVAGLATLSYFQLSDSIQWKNLLAAVAGTETKKPVPGQCKNGPKVPEYSCTVGDSQALDSHSKYNWKCLGKDGGADATCSMTCKLADEQYLDGLPRATVSVFAQSVIDKNTAWWMNRSAERGQMIFKMKNGGIKTFDLVPGAINTGGDGAVLINPRDYGTLTNMDVENISAFYMIHTHPDSVVNRITPGYGSTPRIPSGVDMNYIVNATAGMLEYQLPNHFADIPIKEFYVVAPEGIYKYQPYPLSDDTLSQSSEDKISALEDKRKADGQSSDKCVDQLKDVQNLVGLYSGYGGSITFKRW